MLLGLLLIQSLNLFTISPLWLSLSIVRLHQINKRRTIAIDDPVTWCVCQSVCNVPAPRKNDCTDRGLVWSENFWGSKKHCIRWGSDPPTMRGRKRDSMRLSPKYYNHPFSNCVVVTQSWVSSGGDTAAECCSRGDDDDHEYGSMTYKDVYSGQDVDRPITPVTWSVQLLVKVRQPHTKHPTVSAHEPRQQKTAQQKLRKPEQIFKASTQFRK